MKRPNECTQVEYQLHILRGLLSYHERMMVGAKAAYKEYGDDFSKIQILHFDGYVEALKEAIRCIEIVHKDELLGS